MTKTCPFAPKKECNSDCPLFIAPEDLNEFVTARLSSIGVVDRKIGSCSLKVLALSQSRLIFERTNAR